MNPISSFFNRIQNKHTQEIYIRSVISDALKNIAGINIDINKIKIRSGVITCSGISSVEKSQIFIKKKIIIEAVNTQQNNKIIVDIQ